MRLGQKDFRNSLLLIFKIDRLDKKANETENLHSYSQPYTGIICAIEMKEQLLKSVYLL